MNNGAIPLQLYAKNIQHCLRTTRMLLTLDAVVFFETPQCFAAPWASDIPDSKSTRKRSHRISSSSIPCALWLLNMGSQHAHQIPLMILLTMSMLHVAKSFFVRLMKALLDFSCSLLEGFSWFSAQERSCVSATLYHLR
jgi:hypothetical protein